MCILDFKSCCTSWSHCHSSKYGRGKIVTFLICWILDVALKYSWTMQSSLHNSRSDAVLLWVLKGHRLQTQVLFIMSACFYQSCCCNFCNLPTLNSQEADLIYCSQPTVIPTHLFAELQNADCLIRKSKCCIKASESIKSVPWYLKRSADLVNSLPKSSLFKKHSLFSTMLSIYILHV